MSTRALPASSARDGPIVHYRRAPENRSLLATLKLIHPRELIRLFRDNKELIFQFTHREIISRYRGSNLGLAWAFLTPVLMLSAFTLVFGLIFQARWGAEGESRLKFALILFCGLIIFNVFSECVTRAPSLIVGHANLVKKVVFPLEILPVVLVASALAHAGISFLILIMALWLGFGVLQWTLGLLPLILIPLVLWCLGLGWFLASLGTFLRDIGHVTGFAATITLFLSPIFYPLSAVPLWLRPVYVLNPLTFIISDARSVIIWGEVPNWHHVVIGTVSAAAGALAGFAWFQRTRRGFADAL